MLGMAACFEAAALGAKTRFSCRTDSIVLVAMRSSGGSGSNKALNRGLVKFSASCLIEWPRAPGMLTIRLAAGLPALHGSEPGQVRKEAATAILCKCRG